MAHYAEYAILSFIAVIAFCAQSGSAISCFICNSHEDYDGEACTELNVNSTSSPLYRDCSKETAPAGRTFERCRIQVQEVGDDKRIIRSCATATWQKHEHKSGDCYDRTGSSKVKLRYCECATDGCNSAASLYASIITLTVAMLIGRSLF